MKTRLPAIIATFLLACSFTLPVSEGNSVRLLQDGGEFFPELFKAISSARSSVSLEYYSIGSDSVSVALLELLASKSMDGVDVHLLYDRQGSRHRDFPVDRELLESYGKKGVKIAVFNDMPASSPLPRDHRKLAVIDCSTAFVGGININDKYIRAEEGLGTVHDLALRIDGPLAADLEKIFAETWNTMSDGDMMEPHRDTAPACGETRIETVATRGADSDLSVRDVYVDMIDGASSRIRIVNGYFMPSAPIMAALRRAARRGVKVDILFGDNTDLPGIIHDRPFSMAGRLAGNDNVSVHMCHGCFFHAKAMSIDGKRLLVGSTNLDFLSRRINYELSLIVEDGATTARFDEMYDGMCGEE